MSVILNSAALIKAFFSIHRNSVSLPTAVLLIIIMYPFLQYLRHQVISMIHKSNAKEKRVIIQLVRGRAIYNTPYLARLPLYDTDDFLFFVTHKRLM